MTKESKPGAGKSFADLVGDVKPLASERAIELRPKPAPSARFRRADDAAVLRESLAGDPESVDGADRLSFRQPRISNDVLRGLRRGRYVVQSELDLHGLTAGAAREALDDFLAECRARRHRCVRIIHGKGKGSRAGQPVLKPKVSRWLRRRASVLAFCSARPIDGGTGALYVLLESS